MQKRPDMPSRETGAPETSGYGADVERESGCDAREVARRFHDLFAENVERLAQKRNGGVTPGQPR